MQKGCMYCNRSALEGEYGETNLSLCAIIETNDICDILIDTFIEKDRLITHIMPDVRGVLAKDSIQIRYCPMCGRELSNEENN